MLFLRFFISVKALQVALTFFYIVSCQNQNETKQCLKHRATNFRWRSCPNSTIHNPLQNLDFFFSAVCFELLSGCTKQLHLLIFIIIVTGLRCKLVHMVKWYIKYSCVVVVFFLPRIWWILLSLYCAKPSRFPSRLRTGTADCYSS